MNKSNSNYFKVIAKCGHVGRCNYIPVSFAIIAQNGKEAAKLARQFPRVKHDHKDAILRCDKISYEEYLEIKQMNDNDAYLKCKSRHSQNYLCDLTDRLEVDDHQIEKQYDRQERIDRVHHKLSKYNAIVKSMMEVENYEYVY